MKKNVGMPRNARAKFFKKDRDIDDSTFNIWKSELQRELSSFWESMRKL